MPRRQHLSSGQRAMALAKIAPEPDGKGGRGKSSKILEVHEGNERAAMQQAVRKVVLAVTPAVADRVLAGTRKAILLPVQTTQICRLRRFDCQTPCRMTGLISCRASDERDPQKVSLPQVGNVRPTAASRYTPNQV